LPHSKKLIRLYSGEWHDNRRHGHGTLYHPAGAARKHVGEFRHGLRHGEGRLYLEVDDELQVFAGVWDKDFAVRLAGIRWQPERIPRLSWRAAKAYCERQAMRLPSLRELRVVHLAHAKGFRRGRTYWTSENTTDQLAYVLNFETGDEATRYTGDRNHLLCFR
jgi:hypothetical protein